MKRCLAEANLVQGDLLQILAQWSDDISDSKVKEKIALACLELLVPLTWELEVDEEKTTRNHARHLPYIQLAQVAYKRAVLGCDTAPILRTIVKIGLPSMGQPRRERSRRDEGIIKIMLFFFRNIIQISQPQNLPSQGDENDIGRSAVIGAYHGQDILDLLLTVGSNCADEFQDHDVVLLEILFQLLKGVDAEKLFMQKQQVANQVTNEFKALLQKEKAMLNSYKKTAPSRHQRFGTLLSVQRDDGRRSTVSGQGAITDEKTALQMMDKSKKWNKPKYRGKRDPAVYESTDFGSRVDLTESARKHLQCFVANFLDGAFNPLFASLRKAIEREAERVSPRHSKQYFYLIAWFLEAEQARRENKEGGKESDSQENNFAFIAAVLDQETFVLLNRTMQTAYDSKEHSTLRATLLAFTQILLTVQAMAESKDEEDQEIADNIQQRIFYEESTHDRIIQVLRGYTNQGLGYLDAVTECVHVFIRMLERYSKQNVDLQIRSKRRARKKRDPNANAEEDAEAAQEEQQEAQMTVRERKFDFDRFSHKFLTQGCMDTFITLLQFYNELSLEQLKRCHRYLYRLAFKNDLALLLFRVDILQLLHRMIKGPESLDVEYEGFKEWEQLVRQVFRRCIKWLQKENMKEVGMVEMLFSKIPQTLFYLQNGYERVVEQKAPRPPAEIEVKPSVDEKDRLAVAVSLLVELNKSDALQWVKGEMRKVVTEREAFENQQNLHHTSVMNRHYDSVDDSPAAAHAEAPKPVDMPAHFLTPDNNERKDQLFKDKHLRLLLMVLGFKRLGLADDTEASWTIPGELPTTQLRTSLETIQRHEFDPPTFENGTKQASAMIRTKQSHTNRSAANALSSEEIGSDSDSGGAMFPSDVPVPGERTAAAKAMAKKRKRLTRRNKGEELTEEQKEERAEARRKKQREKAKGEKSAQFITAAMEESDDEADEAFFRLEEERRRKTSSFINDQLAKEERKAAKAAKKGGKRAVSVGDESSSEEDLGALGRVVEVDRSSEGDAEDGVRRKRRKTLTLLSSDDDDSDVGGRDEETPMSDTDSDDGGRAKANSNSTADLFAHRIAAKLTSDRAGMSSSPLRDVSGNAATGDAAMAEAGDEGEEAPITVKPAMAKRNVRAGFILDDSDDE